MAVMTSPGSIRPSAGESGTTSLTAWPTVIDDVVAEALEGDLNVATCLESVIICRLSSRFSSTSRPLEHVVAGDDVDVVVEPALGEAQQGGLAQRHGRVADRAVGRVHLGARHR